MQNRLNDFSLKLIALGVRAYIETDQYNIRYLSGFDGSDALLFVSGRFFRLLVDSRFTLQAKKKSSCPVIAAEKGVWRKAADLAARRCGQGKSKSRCFVNASATTLSDLKFLHKYGPVRFKGLDDPVLEARRIKEQSEIRIISRAQRITEDSFNNVFSLLKPGMSEKKAASIIDSWFIDHGAEPAFETIVACGSHSAMPHARPGKGVLKTGKPIIIDMGARWHGYCADMTRTVFLGRIPPKWELRYRAVLDASKAAIRMLCPGLKASDVDMAARRELAGYGLEKAFIHALGHGVGLCVHELPRLGTKSTDILRPGDMITIEPGIYLPGLGGIRIENMILITERGHRVITKIQNEPLIRM